MDMKQQDLAKFDQIIAEFREHMAELSDEQLAVLCMAETACNDDSIVSHCRAFGIAYEVHMRNQERPEE